MSEYTPTTEEVRECWVSADINPAGYIADGLPVPDEIEQRAEFSRWLAQVKAEAWDLGYYNGWRDRRDFPSRMGATNPYRNGAER